MVAKCVQLVSLFFHRMHHHIFSLLSQNVASSICLSERNARELLICDSVYVFLQMFFFSRCNGRKRKKPTRSSLVILFDGKLPHFTIKARVHNVKEKELINPEWWDKKIKIPKINKRDTAQCQKQPLERTRHWTNINKALSPIAYSLFGFPIPHNIFFHLIYLLGQEQKTHISSVHFDGWATCLNARFNRFVSIHPD